MGLGCTSTPRPAYDTDMSRRRGHEATTLIDEPGYRMLDLGVAHSASGESALHIVEEWTIDGRVFSSDTFVTR